MSDEQPTTVSTGSAPNRNVIILATIAAIALIAASVLGTVLILSRQGDGLSLGGGDPTPTPFASGSDALAGAEPLVVGVSDSETVSVTLDVPATVSLGGREFGVETVTIPENRIWTPGAPPADTAVWLYGTVINYVFGLRDTDENRALLEELAPGDQMVMATRGGTEFAFTFNSRNLVPTSNTDVFVQNTPGITLLLVGSEGDERLVVNGRYIVAEAGGGPQSPGNVAELGETTQLNDAQITVTGATYVLDRPEAAPGFAFYLVDYQIQNVGLTALDVSQLKLLLVDGLGNQYALNPAASQLGNFQPLGGFINAGQTVQATAGYQIPVGLNTDGLTWIVSHADGGQIQVNIPFSGGANAARQAAVSLFQAQVSSDLTSLIISGEVSNFGDQPLVVGESNVSLRGEDGSVYLLLSTNPPLPWSVPAGQTIQYSVTFQRPVSSNAVFTVLNQPFELSNLR